VKQLARESASWVSCGAGCAQQDLEGHLPPPKWNGSTIWMKLKKKKSQDAQDESPGWSRMKARMLPRIQARITRMIILPPHMGA